LLTPFELRLLSEQWIERENRQARPVALLTATVANMFNRSGQSVEYVDLLPFPPGNKYLSEEESEHFLDNFFGKVAGASDGN